jgi:oligopeptide/dipeptide ABC transporter ATP-binding protein
MTETLLEVEGLKVHFPIDDGWQKRDRRVVRAVDGVSFSLQRGEVLAIVGESGCGKTTLGRTIVGLANPTAGTIEFRGKQINKLSTDERRTYRQNVQMVFQDPFDSMNPRKSAFQTIAEPLSFNKIVPKTELRAEVLRLFDIVGLSPGEAYLNRSRYQLSGGERQRVCIARSISVQPAILVADEPVSALDISIQGQILSLLQQLKQDFQVSYIFISHDLSVVRSLADRIMIVYLGQVVEEGSSEEVFKSPQHPYTLALLAAHPIPDPVLSRARARIVLTGDVPSPIDPPSGCRFHMRCPMAEPVCAETAPSFMTFGKSHRVACHFADQVKSRMDEQASSQS